MHECAGQAVELLESSPEHDDIRRGHAEFFLTVAESANLNAGKLRPGGQRIEIALGRWRGAQEADPPHPVAMLCARCERPRRRAAEQRDELTPFP